MRTLMPASVLLVALVCSSACRAPDPAPPSMTVLFEEVLVGLDSATSEDTARWSEQLLFRSEELLADFEGDIHTESLAAGLESLDIRVATELGIQEGLVPADALGIMTLRVLPCTLAQMDAFLLAPDQQQLFPDNYEAYERFFAVDPGCWQAGTCDHVYWSLDIEQNIAGLYRIDYSMESGIRRGADPQLGTFARTWMPEPAGRSSDIGGYDQNYQAELYLPYPGGVLHVYGIWTDAWVAGQLEGDATDAFWANQYINGVEEYDDRYAELCTQ